LKLVCKCTIQLICCHAATNLLKRPVYGQKVVAARWQHVAAKICLSKQNSMLIVCWRFLLQKTAFSFEENIVFRPGKRTSGAETT
jgi:hypothetical protein